MKKNAVTVLFLLLMISVSMSTAFAASGTPAGTGTQTNPYVVIDEADILTVAKETCYVTLGNNITLSTMLSIEGSITLELNGFSILPSSSGTWGNPNDALIAVKRGAHLTINDAKGTGAIDGSSHANIQAAVKLTAKGEPSTGDPAILTINNGTIQGNLWGVVGNGSRDNTEIYMNGGKISGGYEGIYHPQNGFLKISGGEISGPVALAIYGGDVEITGGTFTSADGAALHVCNLHEHDHPSGYGKIAISVTGGKFLAPHGVSAVQSEASDMALEGMILGFLKGGAYSSDVIAYIADGYHEIYQNNLYYITLPNAGSAHSDVSASVFSISESTSIDIPQTGDSSRPWLWTALILTGGIALIRLFSSKRKRSVSEAG